MRYSAPAGEAVLVSQSQGVEILIKVITVAIVDIKVCGIDQPSAPDSDDDY